MSAPRVSVLMPVRDAPGTVERAARSILAQTVRELELVVVDDGSEDGTPELLGRLAAADPRVRIISAERRGLVPALNRGLVECRAPFIARMDADDESLPERLEASLAALEGDGSLAAVGTQVEIVREDRPVSPAMAAYGTWLNSLTSPELLERERFIESPLCHPASALRRAAFDGWRDGPFAEDYELWLRLVAQGRRLTCIPRMLFRWTDREGRLTRTDPRYEKERMLALKADFLSREHRRCAIWGAGPTGLTLARALASRGVEVTRFIDVDPRKVGQRIDRTPVEPASALGAPSEHLLAAVGARGAREEIRAFLTARGWREGPHFTCVA